MSTGDVPGTVASSWDSLEGVPPLLEIRGLTVAVDRGKNGAAIPLLNGVDLTVNQGEVVGLVGESGCGKTMTALAVLGLLPPHVHVTGGTVVFHGRDGATVELVAGRPDRSIDKIRALRGKHITMIFQEPMTSLNPLLTVGSQLAEIVAAHGGLTGAANRARCVDLLAAVNIADAEKVYAHMPYRLSGGMRQRVMIAAALASEPELIIADEPTTALDVTTQAQIPDLFADLRRRVNSAFIFVTHDLGVIAEIADRAAVVYAGYVVEECSVAELFAAPAHPYTFGLMAARQKRRFGNTAPLYTIPGTVPTPGTHGPGCPFAPRCARATALCAAAVPPLAEITGGHKARCWALDKNG